MRDWQFHIDIKHNINFNFIHTLDVLISTSEECFENKWFYMKYIKKYLGVEILLTRECTCIKLFM
jgi:hypothetical protein